MKGIAILAATAALVGLAGCNKIGGSANTSANAATSNAAAPAAAGATNQAGTQSADAGKLNSGGGAVPASSSGAVTLDRAFLMGRWTDDNDCNNVIAFNQDGGFVAANGGTGLWNLDGDWLTLTGNQTARLRIVPIDQNTITVVHTDGSLGRSTRC
jgi:hypothetical protein